MPAAKRTEAALAFWNDESENIDVQHAEALSLMARRLNFRAKTLQQMAADRLAKHLAHCADVSDAIATRALIAYHFATKRPLMSGFLDALGITHDNGLIADESLPAPAADRIDAAAAAVRTTFDPEDVNLYLRTLAALDGETWAHVAAALESAQ